MVKIFLIGAVVMSVFMGIVEVAQVTSFNGPMVAALGGQIGFGIAWFIWEGVRVLILVYILQALGCLRVSQGGKGQ